MRLGVIADTHGLLRPEVFHAFAEVDHILHAGDLGPLDLLTELEAMAPVTAVYGNTDGEEVRRQLPQVIVNKRQKSLRRLGVAPLHRKEDTRGLVH